MKRIETLFSSLPTTITGIVFWGMVLFGLLVISLLSRQFEQNLVQNRADKVSILSYQTELYLAKNSPEQLAPFFEQQYRRLEFEGLSWDVKGEYHELGRCEDENMASDTQISAVSNVHLTIYFKLKAQALNDYRRNLVMWIGGGSFLFSFLLINVLHRIITRPILDMVEVAKRFTEGDMLARFDEHRRDELGYVAQFINSALENLLRQQAATQLTMEKLRTSEEEVRKHSQDLELAVEKRTQELTTVNAELEAFSYSVSHDLRAPLRSLDGFSQMLIEDYRDKLDGEGLDLLNRIRKNAQKLGVIIDDLLALSKVTRRTLKFESVDLNSLATEAATMAAEQYLGVHFEFDNKDVVKLHGDPNLLSVLMNNLLNNAFKYSHKVVSPKIRFESLNIDGESVFCISDNGVGFNQEYAARLFEPFQRLHKAADFEGTGVGLATVQRVIQRHNGRIWAESELGKGSRFYFVIPVVS